MRPRARPDGSAKPGSVEELTELHAIGSKRAELVLSQRPYHQVQELQRIPGITANIVAQLHQHHINWTNTATHS
jgi:DNA uptake protein ComE-like DNA-binding protein